MNKVNYTPQLVGLAPENEFLDDQVMNGKTAITTVKLDVPIMKGTKLVGVSKKQDVQIAEDFGAMSLVDEDLLIAQHIKAGEDFEVESFKGGYKLNFGSTVFFTRKAKPKEFSSIHAYITREDNVVYNHTFIEKQLWSDFLASNNMSEWRMPFSPESASSLAVSWQMIDANGGKWECVAPSLQKPNYIVRLKHFYLSDPKAASVNIVYGDTPSYDEATHTFTVQAGCKIRLWFINTPMGQKEWSTQVEFNLDTNQIKFF